MNLYLNKLLFLSRLGLAQSGLLLASGILIFSLSPHTAQAQSDNPQVEEVEGQVTRFDEASGAFVQVEVGFEITQPIFFATGEDADLILSFPGKVAARFSEGTRAIVNPVVRNRYEVELEVGTLSVLLDPTRDPKKDPVFAIRTDDGVVEAKGTFYAITEYQGQTYTSVKRGKVFKREAPPSMDDFAAYSRRPKDEEEQLAQAETSQEEDE
tara:strand:- start:64 stop:696 length:633 start_codon:yes stop_codon:yes gene_type:complete